MILKTITTLAIYWVYDMSTDPRTSRKIGEYKSVADILNVFRDYVLPPERITVTEAAIKYRTVYQPPVYTGPWDESRVPYATEILNCLESKEYSAVCNVAPAQSAKTDNNFNWLSYIIKCDPSDFMLVEKTKGEARSFSMLKLDRVLRHSPHLREQMVTSRNNDNVFDKRFKSGAFMQIAWPTIDNLSGKTIRRVSLSDYDRMDDDIGGEGSAFDLARRRTNVYKRLGMTYVESSPSKDVEDLNWTPSTPHEAPPCKGILGIYNRSDRRRWYWKCPHCGKRFEPTFELFKWANSSDLKECAESVYMACPHCFTKNGAMILPYMKYELNLEGRWLREGQFFTKNDEIDGKPIRSDIAGFWLKGPAAAFSVWETLTINYLSALDTMERTGDVGPLKTTINTDQAYVYFPKNRSDRITAEKLKETASDLGFKVVPLKIRCLFATVDTQSNRFIVQVHGIVPAPNGYDVVVIDRFELRKSKRLDEDGHPLPLAPGTYKEDWEILVSEVINKKYPMDDKSGRTMTVSFTICDSGGKDKATANAYSFYRALKKSPDWGKNFLLCKGEPKPDAPRAKIHMPDSERKDRTANARGEIPVLFINSNMCKDWVYETINRREPGGGYIEFVDWFDLDFYKEIFAEEQDPKTKKWGNPKRKRNETFDLLYYLHGLCAWLGCERIDWDNPPEAARWAKPPETNIYVSAGNDSHIANKKKVSQTIDNLSKLAQVLG